MVITLDFNEELIIRMPRETIIVSSDKEGIAKKTESIWIMPDNQEMKVIDILRMHKKLWSHANSINPAMKPQGSNFSWNDYYEAVKKAQDYESKEVKYMTNNLD